MEKCPIGQLPCANNVGCYGVMDICNGKAECQDGSDEKCGLTTHSSFTSSPTACSTGATCLDYDGVKICLTESDMCDGMQQCKEGFDELNCGNPYILPTVVSLSAVLVIIVLMCAVYKFCVYRYSSARVNTDQSTSCSTIFLKKQASSETRINIDQLQLEPSDKSSEVSEEEEAEADMPEGEEERQALHVPEEGAAQREQCVQYPSQEEEELSEDSSTQWVSTKI